jgi:hypothetical protein
VVLVGFRDLGKLLLHRNLDAEFLQVREKLLSLAVASDVDAAGSVGTIR